MRVVATFPTPWAAYAVAFTHDGTRLAIGGGTRRSGGGGIAVVDLASHATTLTRADGLVATPTEASYVISAIAFGADDRQVVVSAFVGGEREGAISACTLDGRDLVSPRQLLPPLPRTFGPITGLVLDDGQAILRRHRVERDSTFTFWTLPDDIVAPRSGQHLRGARLVILDDTAIPGRHGVLTSGYRSIEAGLVVAPLDGRPEGIHAADRARDVTAIAPARSRDALFTGGPDGELDRWTHQLGWQPRRIRKPTSTGPLPGPNEWRSYTPSAITGICSLVDGARHVAVAASGELTVFDDTAVRELYAVSGSPRAIAAHPDRPWVAVAVKGSVDGAHGVALVEIESTALDPAWITPSTVAMARACAQSFEAQTLDVLADALEEVGAPSRLLDHLRDHDHPSCWIVDALLR